MLLQDDDDQLRRSPGTPVFTAPECCLGHLPSLIIFKLGPNSLVCIENKQISFCFWILETVSTYSGRAADTWAVGVTLYYMILGQYPFLADTLQDTYDKVWFYL